MASFSKGGDRLRCLIMQQNGEQHTTFHGLRIRLVFEIATTGLKQLECSDVL